MKSLIVCGMRCRISGRERTHCWDIMGLQHLLQRNNRPSRQYWYSRSPSLFYLIPHRSTKSESKIYSRILVLILRVCWSVINRKIKDKRTVTKIKPSSPNKKKKCKYMFVCTSYFRFVSQFVPTKKKFTVEQALKILVRLTGNLVRANQSCLAVSEVWWLFYSNKELLY